MIKKCVLDAVIGTFEIGGESAPFPAAGVSAAAPVAASVGGGHRSHPFWPEVHRVDHRSVDFVRSAVFSFRLCDCPCRVISTRLS